MTKLIELTEHYAIRSDGTRQFQLYERKTIDPTKAPGWLAKLADNPDADPTPYAKWVALESYHGRLDSALNKVITLETLRAPAEDIDALKARLTKVHELIAAVLRTYDFTAELARHRSAE